MAAFWHTCSAELFKRRGVATLGQTKKIVFAVTRPTLFFTPDPKYFIGKLKFFRKCVIFKNQICYYAINKEVHGIMPSIEFDRVLKTTQKGIHKVFSQQLLR
jgi:hypothetical protein